jgi:hypothetical protein
MLTTELIFLRALLKIFPPCSARILKSFKLLGMHHKKKLFVTADLQELSPKPVDIFVFVT